MASVQRSALCWTWPRRRRRTGVGGAQRQSVRRRGRLPGPAQSLVRYHGPPVDLCGLTRANLPPPAVRKGKPPSSLIEGGGPGWRVRRAAFGRPRAEPRQKPGGPTRRPPPANLAEASLARSLGGFVVAIPLRGAGGSDWRVPLALLRRPSERQADSALPRSAPAGQNFKTISDRCARQRPSPVIRLPRSRRGRVGPSSSLS